MYDIWWRQTLEKSNSTNKHKLTEEKLEIVDNDDRSFARIVIIMSSSCHKCRKVFLSSLLAVDIVLMMIIFNQLVAKMMRFVIYVLVNLPPNWWDKIVDHRAFVSVSVATVPMLAMVVAYQLAFSVTVVQIVVTNVLNSWIPVHHGVETASHRSIVEVSWYRSKTETLEGPATYVNGRGLESSNHSNEYRRSTLQLARVKLRPMMGHEESQRRAQ